MKTMTKSVTYLGRCARGCKGRARILCLVEAKTSIGAYGRRVTWSTVTAPNGATYRTDNASTVFFPCLCGRAVAFKRLIARKNEQPCGAKCLGSHGPVCDCSCGGKNHGASFSAGAQ